MYVNSSHVVRYFLNFEESHKYLAPTTWSPINGLIWFSFLDIFLANKSNPHVPGSRTADSEFWETGKLYLLASRAQENRLGSSGAQAVTCAISSMFVWEGVFREKSYPCSQSSPLLGRSQVLFGNEESTRWSGLGAGCELMCSMIQVEVTHFGTGTLRDLDRYKITLIHPRGDTSCKKNWTVVSRAGSAISQSDRFRPISSSFWDEFLLIETVERVTSVLLSSANYCEDEMN